jgi:hypothetical protein
LEAELKPALDTITAKDAEAGSGPPAMPYTDPKSALTRKLGVSAWPNKKLLMSDDSEGFRV